MKKIPLVSFKEEFEILKKDYVKSFEDQLDKSQFIGGEAVLEFEEKIKEFLSINEVISVGNGTDALVIGIESVSHNLKKKGNKIIVPAFSFFATSEAVVKAGFEPVFVDVFKESGNIDVNQIEERIDDNVIGILPVHLFGKSAEMDKILDLKKKYELFIVEDVAQAFGSKYMDQNLGTIGDVGCFSFFPSKNLGAFGDGGMIITNNKESAKISRMLRNHGAEKKYSNTIFGYNSRLDSIQANFLTIKLEHMNKFLHKRVKVGEYYKELLSSNKNIELMDYENSTFNYFSLCVPEHRDSLAEYLKDKGISTAIYYPIPLPYLEAHKTQKDKSGSYPNADYLSKNILSIPIWPLMENELVEYVVSEIDEYFKNYS
tara:strand:+ start:905 stop:2023 length:1119 start_codon:yes stop_codon:yes gene_type:complete